MKFRHLKPLHAVTSQFSILPFHPCLLEHQQHLSLLGFHQGQQDQGHQQHQHCQAHPSSNNSISCKSGSSHSHSLEQNHHYYSAHYFTWLQTVWVVTFLSCAIVHVLLFQLVKILDVNNLSLILRAPEVLGPFSKLNSVERLAMEIQKTETQIHLASSQYHHLLDDHLLLP